MSLRLIAYQREPIDAIADDDAEMRGTGGRGDDRISQGDFGFEGTGFWFRGGNNYVTNNVATDANMYGYNIFATNAGVSRARSGPACSRSMVASARATRSARSAPVHR